MLCHKDASLPEILRCCWFYLRRKTQNIHVKLSIREKMCLFSWDTEMSLCGNFFASWENYGVLFILNELKDKFFQLPIKQKCSVE